MKDTGKEEKKKEDGGEKGYQQEKRIKLKR